MAKKFWLPAHKLEPLVNGRGSCIASDRITVDGARVGYMYREPPDSDTDSGWRFFAGDETHEYTDDANKFAIYDVNTIANYDRDIVPLLEAPVDSAFARGTQDALFQPVPLEKR